MNTGKIRLDSLADGDLGATSSEAKRTAADAVECGHRARSDGRDLEVEIGVSCSRWRRWLPVAPVEERWLWSSVEGVAALASRARRGVGFYWTECRRLRKEAAELRG
ncbi:hypothetical protein E2562_007120 [Oryza meyeriana var. granulata]|uniref:DUF834 domain-containing protein n=1 Tax=Oryza meyeriana var. granulata TaxID=110450 RepID=A0A6G1F4U6_9ORYZ|nr:hypothetical protein E2562_007120 [Oryza meyeriana var. granulata]